MVNLLSLRRAIVVALYVLLLTNDWPLSYNLIRAVVVMVVDVGLLTRTRTEWTSYAVTALTTITINAASSVITSTSSSPPITFTSGSPTTPSTCTASSSVCTTFSWPLHDDCAGCVRMVMMETMMMRSHNSPMNYWLVNNRGRFSLGRLVDNNDLRPFRFFLRLGLWLLFFL